MLRSGSDVALVVVGVGYAYEAVALRTRRVPTISALTCKLPRPARIGLLAAAAAWATVHFEVVILSKAGCPPETN